MARSEHAHAQVWRSSPKDGAMNVIVGYHPYVMFLHLISTHTSGERNDSPLVYIVFPGVFRL